MKKHIRFTAFFLAMVMILSLFTGMASAEEGEAESETNLQTQTNETDNTLTLQPITAEDYESFSIRKAPDIISAAEIAENGYIGRVASQEKDLYTLVFKNSNGSYTKKIYSHPVKYVDDTGVVRDISLELGQNKDGSFSTASHEIVTTFKKNPVNGITLDYKDVSIRMVPALTGNKAPAAIRSADNKKITYNLDSTTAYVYELTYAGYKEDIVVKKYTGQTEYTFKLFTNGLTLEKINETYCLTDSNGEVKATIGDVIIFTADERNNTFGSMTYETVRQNQEYVITIHVDADYLKDPNTVYPIRIDPTIEIKYANNGAGAIEDVTINSNAGSDGSSTSLLIGKRNTYGISRVLLKVPALTFDAIPYAASITSATIAIRDIMCQSSSLDIYCHKFLGGTWTESTASWSSVNPNNYGSYLDMYTVSYSNGVAQPTDHSYAFDITSLVREWYSSSSAQNMGVIFKASDEVENATAHNHKTFGSYSSNYRPVFTLVYEDYTSSVSVSPLALSLNEGESALLSASTTLPDATVSWTSSNSAVATYNASTGRVTALKAGTATITATARTGDGLTYSASCAVTVYLPDGVYYIKNMNSNLYLHAKDSGTVNYTDVIQYSKYSTSANIISRLSQMWKIHHIGGGIYTVRPMHQPNLALDVSSGNVDLYTKSDSNIINDIKWTIVWNSTGYMFRNNGSDSKTMQVENSSTSSSASVKASTYSSTSANCRWEITAAQAAALYNTSDGKALGSTNTEYVAPGETRTLSQFSLRAEYFSGTVSSETFTWSSARVDIATVSSTTGKVTGVATGSTTITGVCNSYSVSYTITVNVVANGTYYIKNRSNGTYVDIEGPTMANNTEIHQWAFHGGDSQKWIFTHLGDGYYTIRSANSSINYYMRVKEDSDIVNADIVLSSTAASDGTHWKFDVAPSGGLKIIPKCGESNNYVLATSVSVSDNGQKLIQGDYDQVTIDTLEWFLEGNNTLTVIHYYDQGFVKRNTKDGESYALNLIIAANKNASRKLQEIFGITVIPIYVPYTSVCDDCRIDQNGSIADSDLESSCPHDTLLAASCLTTNKLREKLIEDFGTGSPKITYVLWTGHRMKDDKGDRSNSVFSSQTVIITPFKTSPVGENEPNYSTKIPISSTTLLHELSHQLKAPDHYCYKDKSIITGKCSNEDCDTCYNGYDPDPRTCLMTGYPDMTIINNATMYCNDCLTTIQDHINDHH